jgi:hypothetical protein
MCEANVQIMERLEIAGGSVDFLAFRWPARFVRQDRDRWRRNTFLFGFEMGN